MENSCLLVLVLLTLLLGVAITTGAVSGPLTHALRNLFMLYNKTWLPGWPRTKSGCSKRQRRALRLLA